MESLGTGHLLNTARVTHDPASIPGVQTGKGTQGAWRWRMRWQVKSVIRKPSCSYSLGNFTRNAAVWRVPLKIAPSQVFMGQPKNVVQLIAQPITSKQWGKGKLAGSASHIRDWPTHCMGPREVRELGLSRSLGLSGTKISLLFIVYWDWVRSIVLRVRDVSPIRRVPSFRKMAFHLKDLQSKNTCTKSIMQMSECVYVYVFSIQNTLPVLCSPALGIISWCFP